MAMLTYAALLGAAASTVYGHGCIVRAGSGTTETDVGFIDYNDAVPVAKNAGWATKQTDLGYVSDPTSPDMACHKNATAGISDMAATAGSTFNVYWDHPGAGEIFPASHHGPILSYLAKCTGDTCVGVQSTSLDFFKIQESGLTASGDPGTWATDVMIAANGTVPINLPAGLPDGAYVLRNEIIALHSAGSAGGAQFYPQCINLKISGGSGTLDTSGVSATKLYTATDPGILISIYQDNTAYPIPGPAVVGASGSGSTTPQPASSSSSAAPAPTTTTTTTTSAAPAPPTTTTTTAAPTTLQTSASVAPATTSAAAPAPSSTSSPTHTGSTKPLPSGTTLEDIYTWFGELLKKQQKNLKKEQKSEKKQ